MITNLDNNSNKFTITPDEKQCIDSLRDLFHDKLPADLDTDLNLRRWVNGWRGRLDEIEPRLKAYVENRKALKLDRPDYLHNFTEEPNFKKVFHCFSLSRIDKPYINSKDNTMVMIERLENIDLHTIANKVLTCGEILTTCFRCMEAAFRQVLAQEKLSGRPSGITIIYDAYGLNVLEYVNPNAAIIKITKLCFSLFQDYYCDVLHQIYVVNAPKLIGLCWEIVKRFMSASTHRKMIFLGSNFKEVLSEKLDLEVLPVRYGGLRTDHSDGVDPETCCYLPVLIPENFQRVSKFVDDNDDDAFVTEYIKPYNILEVSRKIDEANVKLRWTFWTNSDVEFCIMKENSNNERSLAYCRLTFITPKLAEEGEIVCEEPGNYILQFKNVSTSWFSLKLDYWVKIID